MKIKVVKASSKSCWYANLVPMVRSPIGETVLPEGEAYIIGSGSPFLDSLLGSQDQVILKKDCEIVDERKETDTTKSPDWRIKKHKGEWERKIRQRNQLQTKSEIEHYEELNEKEKITTYNLYQNKENK